MSRYLFMASYSSDGAKGLLEKGGATRREVVAKTAESVGGRLESLDFAFGKHDVFVIVDLPDHAAAAKVALTVAAAGTAVETVVLIDAADLPASSGGDVSYTAPGG